MQRIYNSNTHSTLVRVASLTHGTERHSVNKMTQCLINASMRHRDKKLGGHSHGVTAIWNWNNAAVSQLTRGLISWHVPHQTGESIEVNLAHSILGELSLLPFSYSFADPFCRVRQDGLYRDRLCFMGMEEVCLQWNPSCAQNSAPNFLVIICTSSL